jgi:hypothetical protein
MDAGMGGAGIEQLPSLLSTAAEAAARYTVRCRTLVGYGSTDLQLDISTEITKVK